MTEDGLRVYNIQLCLFLFVTSKSKETLWLCVLGLSPPALDIPPMPASFHRFVSLLIIRTIFI